MPDPNFSRINGTPYSWTSCAHFFQGIPYKGIVASSFKETREVKVVRAGQQDGVPLGLTAGQYEIESFTFRMLRESAQALMLDLTVLGLGSFGDAEWSYTVQLYEPGIAIPPRLPSLTMISGCRITGVEDKQEQGIDELVTEFTCKAITLRRVVGGTPLQLWSAIRTLLP